MNTDRNIYLRMHTLQEARQRVLQGFNFGPKASVETVAVPDAVGRVLAEAVHAQISSPNFHAAAMDGIAVRAEDTYGASEAIPRQLTVGRDAFYVNTGHVLPEDTDAVIMIEHVRQLADDQVAIEASVFPWQNVRKMGEDIVATELLFVQNHLVTPYCVGAMLSGGVFEVAVRPRPRVCIIPTGSELVDWRTASPQALRPGEVLESNSYVLGKMTEACGGTFVRHELVMDRTDRIREALQAVLAQDFDLVLLVGGSSAGTEDFTRAVVAELGEVLVHGVTIMPGKPVIIGQVGHTPVFGMPGYPVSAIVAFEQFVQPLLFRLQGRPEPQRPSVMVEPARKISSKIGVEEFLRVKLGQVGDRIVATPLPRGAGCITTLTEADGIIRVPNHVEGIRELPPVAAELLRPLETLRDTVVIVGSHDNTLDVLADEIRARHSALTISSSHVGSLGGLMAIKRGVCHLAGSHLLDTADGSYNRTYIRKYLQGVDVRLIHLVFRDQGLMVLPKNPKNIKGIEDLSRPDVTMINRQAGSGTRILLDYRLQELNIDAAGIKGYQEEEFTHMSVAAAIVSRRADVGLGIYAAARALKLDFIPVVTEQYDLVIPEAFFDTANIQMLLETIASRRFRRRVEALGGYSTRMTGQQIEI